MIYYIAIIGMFLTLFTPGGIIIDILVGIVWFLSARKNHYNDVRRDIKFYESVGGDYANSEKKECEKYLRDHNQPL